MLFNGANQRQPTVPLQRARRIKSLLLHCESGYGQYLKKLHGIRFTSQLNKMYLCVRVIISFFVGSILLTRKVTNKPRQCGIAPVSILVLLSRAEIRQRFQFRPENAAK
jgi:hypothetical protein